MSDADCVARAFGTTDGENTVIGSSRRCGEELFAIAL